MHIGDYIVSKFPNPSFGFNEVFKLGKPTPNLVVDEFLPKELAYKLHTECSTIPDDVWTDFTRKGSHMKECKSLIHMHTARQLIEEMNGSQMIRWLEQATGIQGLIGDPHITGAGYCKSYQGDTLQIHNDFNWNDELRLHRALSVIIYLTPGWKPQWGGALEFYNDDQTRVVKSVDCLFNRMLMWSYTPKNYHGYVKPISCPENISRNALRLFYYTSNSTHNPNDPPHRSQYWYDPATNAAYDNRNEK